MTEAHLNNDQDNSVCFPHNQRFGLLPPQPIPGNIRLVFCNIDGFPSSKQYNAKVKIVREFATTMRADIFGCCEINLHLKSMGGTRILHDWFRSEQSSKLAAAHNVHQYTGSQQFGGTMIMSLGEISDKVCESGKDKTGLGRWCWMYIKGRQGGTRVISAYRPTQSQRSQHRTVYSQHKQYFESLGDATCPREAFFRDLVEAITEWQEQGDRIILMADFNEDVRTDGFKQRMQHLSLKEMILSSRPTSLAPASFYRGDRHGRAPIDSIWASEIISTTASAYCTATESPGDHRAMVIDVPFQLLYGSSLLRTLRPPSRKLTCTNLKAKDTYCQALVRYCQQFRIETRLNELQDSELPISHPSFVQEIEAIDQCLTAGMLSAETNCRRFHMGIHPWSPTYLRASALCTIYKQLVRKRRNLPIQAHKLRRLAQKWNISLQLTLIEAEQLLRDAQLEYAKLKPNAALLRSQFIQAKLDDPSTTTSAKANYTQLLARENARAHARKMAWVKGTTRAKAIASIEIPANDGWMEQSTQAEVEKGISTCMIDRFCLADTCPSRTEPLRSEVSIGSSPWNSAILLGTFDSPPTLSPSTRAFLAQLKYPPSSQTDNTVITAAEFSHFWKKTRESTSSSYSGRHFGHYKAAASDPLLSKIHAKLLSLLSTKGYSLNRWKKGIQVILEKKQGLIRVDKLRAILLMEADFNFMNKFFIGYKMMNRLHESGTMPGELYGGIKHKTATMVALSRRLLADLSRQLRLPFAIASVDAQSCYDRIAHPTASLACQRLGVPYTVTQSMFDTIQNMRFYLRTAYGDSTTFYGGGVQPDGRIPQGVCQGNGAGPAIWIAISLVLLRLMHAVCIPMRVVCSISGTALDLFGTIFVDDTDLLSMANPLEHNALPTIARLRSSVSTWAKGLTTTGGALMPAKCSWSLLHFRWQGNKCTINPNPPVNEVLQVPTLDTIATIQFVSPHESVEIVGVHQSLDGSMNHQFNVSFAKTMEWTVQLRSHYLDRSDAMKGLWNTIWPSISYPLLATTFTASQGQKLSAPLHRAMLPKLGVNRCFPVLLRIAPVCLQGLALPHFYLEQEIRHLEALLTLGGDKILNEGILLTASLEALQLQVGTSQPVLQCDYSRFGHLATPCWLTSVWQFCSSHRIRIAGSIVPPIQRVNDKFLMDILTDPQLHYRQGDIQAANRCRCYFHILTLADVYDGNGTNVQRSFRAGHHRRRFESKYRWLEERPSTTDFQIFHRLLLDATRRQPQQLLEWTTDPHITRRWWHDRLTGTIYHKSPLGIWTHFTRIPDLNELYQPQGITDQVPPLDQLAPANIVPTETAVIHLDGSMDNIAAIPVTLSSLAVLITTTTDWWPLQTAYFPDDGIAMATAISQGTAIAVSDGSYNGTHSPHLGTAAWIMEDSRYLDAGQCSGIVHTTGEPVIVNAYRSELQGLHTILVALTGICQVHRLTQGHVRIGCDGLSALRRSYPKTTLTSQNIAQADIIRAIKRLRMQLPCKISFVHIKGHQDDHQQFHQLPRMTQLNILCDFLAKRYLTQLSQTGQAVNMNAPLMGEGFQCFIEGSKVTSSIHARVLFHVSAPDIQAYLAEKNVLTSQAFTTVNWHSLQDGLDSKPSAFRVWYSKFSSGQLSVGRMMKRWNFQPHDNCPVCHAPNETTLHILQCPDHRMRAAFHSAVSQFEQELLSIDTSPAARTWIISFLRHDHTPEPLTEVFLDAAIADQREIGWQNTLLGRLSRHWTQHQHQHLIQNASRRTSSAWSANVAVSLILISRAMWFTRNAILHLRDVAGRKLSDIAALSTEINNQYLMDADTLLERDQYLLENDKATILESSMPDQRAWLQAILIARANFEQDWHEHEPPPPAEPPPLT